VNSSLAEYWICSLNGNTESLGRLYAVGKNRQETYCEMAEKIVEAVREGQEVCAVSYGHPGIYADPFRESVQRARAEGFPATMLPGISAEDCLFADVSIDLAKSGCRSYEATDFLIHRRGIDPTSSLILWQIGVIAMLGIKEQSSVWNEEGLAILLDTLLEVYRPDHEVVLYEASRFAVCDSIIERVALANVSRARVTTTSTLYIPPMIEARVDEAMLRRLGATPAKGL
jgi:uncharacterized protein YabN with tetrapyrrole methylase and pyrophosphatase domain